MTDYKRNSQAGLKGRHRSWSRAGINRKKEASIRREMMLTTGVNAACIEFLKSRGLYDQGTFARSDPPK